MRARYPVNRSPYSSTTHKCAASLLLPYRDCTTAVTRSGGLFRNLNYSVTHRRLAPVIEPGYPRGSPSPRMAMMFRWISLVPPPIGLVVLCM